MTKNSKALKDVGTSNVSHVSRKPLQCVHIITPYAGYIVEVTFRSHYYAYGLFANTTRLSSGLFNPTSYGILSFSQLWGGGGGGGFLARTPESTVRIV